MVVLNHLAFGARDRSEVSDAMEALGFATSPPCSCEWESRGDRHSAEAVCCVFPHEYLDLITIPDPEWSTHLNSSSLYMRGLAPTGIVLSGVRPAAASQHVGADPYPIVRCVDVDPPIRISYEFLPLSRLGLPLGLISDSAPDALRQVSSLSHPNTASGIARVHLRVGSLEDALRQLSGEPLLLPSSAEIPIGTPSLYLYESPVDGYLARVSELLPSSKRPALLAVDYSVSSLQTASEALQAGGVAFRSGPGALSVDPGQGFGTGIIFSQSAV